MIVDDLFVFGLLVTVLAPRAVPHDVAENFAGSLVADEKVAGDLLGFERGHLLKEQVVAFGLVSVDSV